MSHTRVDKLLVENNIVDSRTLAQSLIAEKAVEYFEAGQWLTVSKPSLQVPIGCDLRLKESDQLRYVSRAGLKLEGALDKISLAVEGKIVLDLGQSTGGFSDCLLQRGCSKVVGVDVGSDQLHKRLRGNERLICLEHINARELELEYFEDYVDEGFDMAVSDLSFISQTLVIPAIPALLKPEAYFVSLVKPQFEVGKVGLAKGGIVKNDALYPQVEGKICECLRQNGFEIRDYFESTISGGDGNREFFVVAQKTES